MHQVLDMQDFEIRAANFCSYGASFVHMDATRKGFNSPYIITLKNILKI